MKLSSTRFVVDSVALLFVWLIGEENSRTTREEEARYLSNLRGLLLDPECSSIIIMP